MDTSHPTPQAEPPRGWLQAARRGWKESKADQVPLLSAGVAFFGFLAIFPALITFSLIWGLVAGPAAITEQASAITGSLPPEARQLLLDQLQVLASAPPNRLGWGLALGLAVALWGASGGIGHLVTAVNIANDLEPERGFVKKKLLALGLTVGTVVFMLTLVALAAGVPLLLHVIGLGGAWSWVILVLRWALIAVLVMVALGVLYRVAPDRDAPKLPWVSSGAVLATILWLLASLGFSLYVSLLGDYSKTYGALAGVVVLLLWLWLTSLAILLGAELNASRRASEVTAQA